MDRKFCKIGLSASIIFATMLPAIAIPPSGAPAAMPKATSDNYLAKGKAYTEAGDFASALKIYEYMSKSFPSEPTFLFMIGELQSALKQPQKAIASFDKGEALLKKNPVPRFRLMMGGFPIDLAKAESYAALKNYAKAEENFNSALKRSGKFSGKVLVRRGFYYLHRNELAKAQSDYDTARKLATDWSDFFNCGVLAGKMGRFIDGEKLTKRANLKKPFDVKILHNGAFFLYELGKDDESLSWFTQAVDTKSPKRLALYADMAQLEKTLGKNELAQEHAREAIKLQNEKGRVLDSNDHVCLGICHTILSDYDKANQEVSLAKKLDPAFFDAERQTARILVLQGKLQEALDSYNKYLENGFACRGYSERAHVLNAMGRKEEAVKDLQTAMSKGYVLADKEIAELNKN